MEINKFREMLGFSQEKFRWGSILIIFTALFISNWVHTVFTLGFWFYWEGLIIRTVFLQIISNFLLAVLLGVSFRLIKNDLLAVFAAILIYIPADSLAWLFVYFVRGGNFRLDLFLSELISNIFYSVSLVGLTVLLAYLLKKPFLAITLGSVFGGFIFYFGYILTNIYLDQDAISTGRKVEITASMVLFRLTISILTGLILAGILSFLIGLSQDKYPIKSGRIFFAKHNYIGAIAANLFISPIVIAGLAIQFRDLGFRGIGITVLILLTALTIIIIGTIAFLTFIYRSWSSIQDGLYARTTPGFAVGGLFIPLYNLYWIFHVVPGFAKDFNKYRQDRQIKIPPLGAGLPLTFCILILVSFIPVVGILANIANIFVTLVMVSRIMDAVNVLQEFKAGQSGQLPQTFQQDGIV